MKNFFIVVVMLAVFIALVACGENGESDETPTPPIELEIYSDPEASLESENGEVIDTAYSETQAEVENSNNELITVRFYYHSMEIDPNAESLPEAFLYEAVDIPAANFEEEFVREFYERTGIPIMNIWFDSRFEDRNKVGLAYKFESARLFVNMREDAPEYFDTRATAGSTMALNIFERTISSIPSIVSFEVLVDGQRGIYGWHFSFNHVTYVENGEVVERIWFDLGMPDDTLTLPNSSDEADLLEASENSVEAAIAQEEDWINLGVISIPPDWTAINTGNAESVFIDMHGRDTDGNLITMQVWGIPFDDPYMFIDEFSSRQEFVFGDGRIGYMLKEPFSEESSIIAAWTDTRIVLSLHYIFSGDESAIYAANEELILRIAGTLTN
jgi:hypothetical protein